MKKVGSSDVPRPSYTESCNWSNPIIINFTQSGRHEDKWLRVRGGPRWGLRLYIGGEDIGLYFTIKLTKTLLNSRGIAIGPNPVLSGGLDFSKKQPLPNPITNSLTPFSTPFPIFQLTLPPRIPSSADTILRLVNSTAFALYSLNVSSYQPCWICFSAQPPFYEGIATDLDPIFTKDPQQLRWHPSGPGLTVSHIVGNGLCLRGPDVFLPSQIELLCDRDYIVNSSYKYIATPTNDTYWACSTGLTTYVIASALLSHHDYCILVYLLPRLSIHQSEDLLSFWDSDIAHLRYKREPLTAITLAVVLGLAATGAGTGIASMVTTDQQLSQLSITVDRDIRELQQGLETLKDSVVSLSEVVLQNRRGLDLLLLKEGGLCVALKEECCFYTDQTGLVQDSIDKVKTSLEERRNLREKQESWYHAWFSNNPWLTTILPSILGPFIGLFLLISFGPWAFSRLTRFIKDQMAFNFPQVHYHQVQLEDPDGDYPSIGRLRFVIHSPRPVSASLESPCGFNY